VLKSAFLNALLEGQSVPTSSHSRDLTWYTVNYFCPVLKGADFDKTLAYLSIAFPEPFRGLIRTTNLLERFHKEIRRKQRDIGMFQSEQGCETLWYLLSRRETAKQRAILQSRS